jgi:hypothetical protein
MSLESKTYPNSKLMKLNAWTVISCFVALLLSGVLVYFSTRWPLSLDIANFTFYIFLITGFGHVVLALILKCPDCGKRPSVQIFRIHDEAEKLWGMRGWIVVIIRIAFYNRFRCIHCASDYVLKSS